MWKGMGWVGLTTHLDHANKNGWQIRHQTIDRVIIYIPDRIGQTGGWQVLDRANCTTGDYWLWVPSSRNVLKRALQEYLPDVVIRQIMY